MALSITFEEFVALHPQFAQVGSTMFEQAIVEASAMVSEDVFGDLYSLAVRMKACHIMALEMYGQQASLKGGETTVYEQKFQQLVRIKGPRGTVT